MRQNKAIIGWCALAVFLLLVGAIPAAADVQFQCPGYVEGVDTDTNGNGLRADEGEISSPVSPNQVCIHLASGDGFISMPNRPDPQDVYIFSFNDVTGIPDANVLKMWDDPVTPGGLLGATAPAPTIAVQEGDEVYLTLTNVGMVNRPDLFDPHTVHWHGFPNASAVFDGVPDNSISINMGASLTYYYNVVEPGTFMYHCHVEATEHMQMGMLGNLWVRPAQDTGPAMGGFSSFAYNDGDGSTGYDQVFGLQLGSFDLVFHDASRDTQPLPFADMKDNYSLINGRAYPDTVRPDTDPTLPRQLKSSKITATAGERVLIRLSNLNVTQYHTVTVLGIPMTVVGNGSRILRGGGLTTGTDLYYQTNSVTLGGGEAMDIVLDTTGIVPGTYFMYTTNLNQLSNNDEDFGGMMTEIEIL